MSLMSKLLKFGHSDVTKLKKITFLPRLVKLCILVAYKFLIKNLNFWGQSVHFWSCDITKHEIYKLGHISAIFKDRDFGLNQKIL